jgi:hypothetical protein
MTSSPFSFAIRKSMKSSVGPVGWQAPVQILVLVVLKGLFHKIEIE